MQKRVEDGGGDPTGEVRRWGWAGAAAWGGGSPRGVGWSMASRRRPVRLRTAAARLTGLASAGREHRAAAPRAVPAEPAIALLQLAVRLRRPA